MLNSLPSRKSILLKTLHSLATLKNCCFKQDLFKNGGVDTLIVIMCARIQVIVRMSGFHMFSESVLTYTECAIIYINNAKILLTKV